MVARDVNIYPPQHLNEIGGRSNNEDSIYPAKPSRQDRLFMVCDGVGGQSKGEVASALTCTYFSEFCLKHQTEKDYKKLFENALSYTEAKLEEYSNSNPECQGMATTLTAVYFSRHYETAHICWAGDSRVYHIRNREILFQTKDHSEVQNLIDMGEISPEEAQNYPRRNVILRAVRGKSSPTSLDYKKIEDIKPEDFFFLCSDGILENFGKKELNDWFSKDVNPQTLKNLIRENAEGKTADNFSMYLLKIKSNEPMDS